MEQEVLKLPFQAFKNVLRRDDLRCRNEDQVLDLLLTYLRKEKDRFCNDLRNALMPMIRLDLLTKERLIELAQSKPDFIRGFEHIVIDALCAKL